MDYGKVTNTTSYQGYGIPSFPSQMPFPFMQQPKDSYPRLPAGEIVWVENEKQIADAVIPPDAVHIYVNKNASEFYIASTDKLGFKSISIYEFKEKEPQEADKPVTRAEFNQLIEALKGVNNERNSQQNQQAGTEPQAQSAGVPTNNQQYGQQNTNGFR